MSSLRTSQGAPTLLLGQKPTTKNPRQRRGNARDQSPFVPKACINNVLDLLHLWDLEFWWGPRSMSRLRSFSLLSMRTFHGHYHYDSANLRYHAVLYDSVTKISSRLVCINNVGMFQKGLREDKIHWRVFITPNMTNRWTRHLRRCYWRGDREPGIGFVTA